MSRLVWVGIGAAGGIMAYRHSQRVWERTKERGVAGNTAAVTRTAAAVYRGIRDAERLGVVDLTEQATTARLVAADGEPLADDFDPVIDGRTTGTTRDPGAGAPRTSGVSGSATRKAAARGMGAAKVLYTARRQGH